MAACYELAYTLDASYPKQLECSLATFLQRCLASATPPEMSPCPINLLRRSPSTTPVLLSTPRMCTLSLNKPRRLILHPIPGMIQTPSEVFAAELNSPNQMRHGNIYPLPFHNPRSHHPEQCLQVSFALRAEIRTIVSKSLLPSLTSSRLLFPSLFSRPCRDPDVQREHRRGAWHDLQPLAGPAAALPVDHALPLVRPHQAAARPGHVLRHLGAQHSSHLGW
jgi:hypothetical protein